MAVPEPTSELGLWPRVKAITGWPEPDEDRMHALAQSWRTAAEQFRTAGEFDSATLPGLWPDPAGEAYATRLNTTLDTALATADGAAQLAARAAYFGDEVRGVKTGIRQLIEANLAAFARIQALLVLLPPGVGAMVEESFVRQLAGIVNQLITDAAGRISAQGGPLPTAPPADPSQSAPPPPDPSTEGSSWLDQVGELGANFANAAFSFGNAALHHPELVLAGATGVGIALAGSAGTAGGVALSTTGVGSVAGVPLSMASAATVGTGATIATAAVLALAAEAAGHDRVTQFGGHTAAATSGPSEPYDRRKHYGTTPTPADRRAAGVGKGEVLDHDPPLVKRYYEGDPAKGERPGHEMTPEERRASAKDRGRMSPQSRDESNKQGGEMSGYSKGKKKGWFG